MSADLSKKMHAVLECIEACFSIFLVKTYQEITYYQYLTKADSTAGRNRMAT